MKTIIIVLSLIMSASLCQAQKANEVNFYVGVVGSELIRTTTLDGAGGTSNSKSYELGVKYVRKLSKKFAIETGVNLFSASVEVTYNDPTWLPFESNFYLLSIPIIINYSLGKTFYLNAGPSIDIQSRNSTFDSQSGIGSTFGIGKVIHINKVQLKINPILEIHSIVPFKKERYHQKLVVLGVQLGLVYEF